jgi:hypothetical protein
MLLLYSRSQSLATTFTPLTAASGDQGDIWTGAMYQLGEAVDR